MRRPIIGPVLTAPFSGAGDIYGIGQGLTAIFDNLPKLGVGSKSRIKETEATANANISQINAQKESTLAVEKAKSKDLQKIMFLGLASVFLIIALIIRARK